MSRADQYREMYNETLKNMDSEDVLWNLRELVEDMILTIEELEKVNYEQTLYLANAKRTQEFIKQLKNKL